MLEHGGNLRHAAQQYGIPLKSWLDLSTGINPNHYPILDIPSRVWQRLPEDNDGLIEAACAYYDCQSLLPTSGSQAAIQVLPRLRPACHILMPRQMYQEHAHAWQSHGHTLTLFDETPNAEILAKVDVMLICNPNNPTGKRFSKKQLLTWHKLLASHHGWLIVDEAFMDTTPNDSIAHHTDLAGLLVLRSLGKFFGLAGTRVGFLLAQQQILTKAQEALGPWSLTGPSRLIATQALNDHTWQVNARKTLSANSLKLKKLLRQYGLSPCGGTHLFQFVLSEQASTIHQSLAKQGIWVRLFKETAALRFGLPFNNDWDKLEQALKKLVNDSQSLL